MIDRLGFCLVRAAVAVVVSGCGAGGDATGSGSETGTGGSETTVAGTTTGSTSGLASTSTGTGTSGVDLTSETGVEPTGGTTGSEPLVEKILFLSDREGVQRLHWMNPDGSDQAPVSAGTEVEWDPHWTSGGAEVLFTRDADVWRLDPETGVEQNVTADPASDHLVTLAPDDMWALFMSDRGDNFRDLFRISIRGGGVEQVTSEVDAENFYADYSPDGARIVYTPSSFEADRLVVMKADGTEVVDLAGPLGLTEISAPAWSPDGTRIAFSGQTSEPMPVLYVVNPDGSGLVALTAGFAGEPTWSPDGQRLAYRGHDGTWRVGVVGGDGSGEVLLTGDVEDCWYPDWSRDGDLLVFDCSDDIYTVAADGGAVHRLTENSGVNRIAKWRP